jgi:hypothetical protein
MNTLSKNLLFIIIFLLMLGGLYVYNLNTTNKVIEYMDNNADDCSGIDQRALKTIHENTKDINTLREHLDKININDIQLKIDNVDSLIKNNTDSLKGIIDQHRSNASDNLNMDVKGDGSVYDEDGKLLYQEK